MASHEAPSEVEYPRHFLVPGPATQINSVIDLMEEWLDDHLEDYNNHTHGTPEDWVDFRSHYANIHWMYCVLIGDSAVGGEVEIHS